jgi:hypothetical protein
VTLLEQLRDQAAYCRGAGSALTADLLDGAAADVEAGGPAADLLAPHADDPRGTVVGLRLAGALHRLVLERRAPALAVHYPSVGGTPGDVWAAAREVVAEQPDVLAPVLQRPVQTNEVGRAAALYGGLLRLATRTDLPVRLLEVGASAGLNLRCDRFAYSLRAGVEIGDATSPVVLGRPWTGDLPRGWPTTTVVERRGCDLAPLDPTSAADRLTLSSYVWADQVDRFRRLAAAFTVAERVPAVVERATASDFLARELAVPRPGVLTVVWHSVVRQYLSAAERRAVDDRLAEAGTRATPGAPLARLSLEPQQVSSGQAFLVELTTWPTGRHEVLATARGHGPPVHWNPLDT